MATDQVTWAPRIDAGGGRYDIPGSTKLDGTMDTVNPQTRILRGSSSFSTTPTIAQINVSSHVNQILGLINRRIRTWNTGHGTSYPVLPYVAVGGRILASTFESARTSVDLLRSLEGASPYAWSSDWPSDDNPRLQGRHLSELRQALAVILVSVQNPTDSMTLTELYTRTKYPFIANVGAGSACVYLKEWNYSSGAYSYLGVRSVNFVSHGAGYEGPFAYAPYTAMYRIRRCLSGTVIAPANRPCSVLLNGFSAANIICRLAVDVANVNDTANYYSSGAILLVTSTTGNVSVEIPIGTTGSNRSIRVHYSCTDEDGATLPPGGTTWGPGENLSVPLMAVKVYYD